MSIKTYMYEKLTDFANLVSNPLKDTKFLEEGVLTPEEFVAAGELLVMKCPSWSWQSASSKNLQKGLPPDKQFLITKNVPSLMRVSALEAKSNNSTSAVVENKDVELEDEGWVATHVNETSTTDEEIPVIPTSQQNEEDEEKDSDDEDVPEINLDDLSIKDGTVEEDEATLSNDNVIKTRTYDISVCYDQYHQTPRVWLFGYDENGRPLKPEEVLQDISQDHAKKTVTIATHPQLGIPQAYIHPCRHAAVMKKIIQRMTDSGKIPRVDQYLFIFLKFIHAAIPTIEYDNTVEMSVE